MNPATKVTGNASGDHSKYNYMTCITYAGAYEDSPDLVPSVVPENPCGEIIVEFFNDDPALT